MDVSAAPAKEKSEEVQTVIFPAGLRAQSKADVSEFTGLFKRLKTYLDATQTERRVLGRALGTTGLQRP